MRTAIRYKILVLLFLTPMFIIANNHNGFSGKHTKEKTITKEFNVASNATLKIKNSYGNINISTYEGSKITFEIRIKTNGDDADKVASKLNDITIDFSSSKDKVSAETLFSKSKSNSWWNWGKSNTVNMEVTYIVKIPLTNNVDLNNDFGNIDLDKLEGRAIIYCDHGKITTKELMAEDNSLNFDYTKNSYFEYVNSGEINADYSDYTIGKARNLSINADFTKSEIEIVEDITYNCDYGSLKINNANNVTGNGDNLTLRLGNIYKNLNLKADYGSIKIETMQANAGNINIESDFNGITIGYHPDYTFKFDIDLEYAALRNVDDFNFTKKRVDATDQYYQGHNGNANSPNIIKIKSEYGSVTFKKN